MALTQDEFLSEMYRVYVYDPKLVDQNTKQQLLDAGYLTPEYVDKREKNDAADLGYFYTGAPFDAN
jgi:hypothetical protein